MVGTAARIGGAPVEHAPSILVVEDDVLVRAAAAQYLRGAGFMVFEAVDVYQALAVLRAGPVDVVFSDIKLPGSLSGLDLMRRVPVEFPAARVLLTSGIVSPEELALDGVTLLRKPYFLFELERHLRRLLRPI